MSVRARWITMQGVYMPLNTFLPKLCVCVLCQSDVLQREVSVTSYQCDICVCVCMREGEGERARGGERERERERGRGREREREERGGQRGGERGRERGEDALRRVSIEGSLHSPSSISFFDHRA